MAIRQSGGRVGRTVRPPDGKPVSRPFCLQSKGHFPISVSFSVLVAACGSKWYGVASFLSRFQRLKRLTFASKRQGKTESAYRRPRLRPSFGQPKGIGQPMPCWVGNDRYNPNPSATDFCVLKDTARCPLSYSKGFGLLPKRPCPMREGASSPKSGSLFPPAVRMPKLRLCRDTTKSIVI